MLTAQLLCFAFIFIALIATYFILKAKHIELKNIIYKIFSLILAGVFFFRFMLGDDALKDIFHLASSPLPTEFTSAVSLILNWMLYSVVLLIILYPFFKTSKMTLLVKYYGSIVSVLCAGFIYYNTLGIVGVNAYDGFNIRTLLMGIEIALLLAYCFVVFMENEKFKVCKKDLWGLLYIPAMLLATMPPYMLQALFGHLNYTIVAKDLNFPHRLILYISILLPILIYLLLRKKDKETIRGILLYIALGTLLSFSVGFKFYTFANVTHWPFHLCNTAMYIIPLCLIFKWNKLFYFTYFINVLGAFLAMVMPNYSSGLNLFSSEIINFYINHFIAFFMPILMVALRVYERPKLKQFKYSMFGFGIYFLLVLILNAWFSNFGTVDYFFINSDFIADKLGSWAEDLRDIVWTFSLGGLTFTFYPLYQFLFFLVYVCLGAGVWFIYEAMYSFVDTLYDIADKKRKINADLLALQTYMGGRSMEEPMNPDGTNKIILKNFSKRYGNSDVYAVKDANLEIVGGEIFGFLGHNGAGKSTIIKSIVGIQPITSGSIEVCGFDVDKQSVMAKRQIGFVPDHYALYEKLTGREYINYIADLYDVSTQDRNNAIDKYVTLFELGDAFDNQIKTYSHGMKQKITIISALVHNPKVWILDEPLTGLDPTSIYQVKECMKLHAKEGNIVFFSSHIIDVVEQICDKIAIIKKGKILTTRYVKDIEKECSLEDFYLKMTDTKVEREKIKKTNLKPLDSQSSHLDDLAKTSNLDIEKFDKIENSQSTTTLKTKKSKTKFNVKTKKSTSQIEKTNDLDVEKTTKNSKNKNSK